MLGTFKCFIYHPVFSILFILLLSFFNIKTHGLLTLLIYGHAWYYHEKKIGYNK